MLSIEEILSPKTNYTSQWVRWCSSMGEMQHKIRKKKWLKITRWKNSKEFSQSKVVCILNEKKNHLKKEKKALPQRKNSCAPSFILVFSWPNRWAILHFWLTKTIPPIKCCAALQLALQTDCAWKTKSHIRNSNWLLSPQTIKNYRLVVFPLIL